MDATDAGDRGGRHWREGKREEVGGMERGNGPHV